MKSLPAKIVRLSLWVVMALLAIITGLYPAFYFILDRKFSLLAFKQDQVLTNMLWNITFYLHIVTGGLALLLGWMQFSGKLRRNYPAFHRKMGWLYIFNALVAAAAGLGLAGAATGGPVSQAGFAFLGLFWFGATYMALKSAGNIRILQHRRFALYSYAACFAAVTLRLWLQLFLYLGVDFLVAYRIVAWLCWIPNIIFAFIAGRKMPENRFAEDEFYP